MDNDRRLFLGLIGTAAVTGLVAYSVGRGSPAEAASFEIKRSPAEWRKRLGPARFHILREAGTETPFTSPLLKENRKGVFACAGCALPLFSSAAKYDSGTGWPSFKKALPNAVAYRRDTDARHGPHRGALPPLRRAPWPCVRRRSAADSASAIASMACRSTFTARLMLLFLLAYLGGILTILTPCILPVLPFVFARADRPFLRNGLPLARRHGDHLRRRRDPRRGRRRLGGRRQQRRALDRDRPARRLRPAADLPAPGRSRHAAAGQARASGCRPRAARTASAARCCSASPPACCGRPAPARSSASS